MSFLSAQVRSNKLLRQHFSVGVAILEYRIFRIRILEAWDPKRQFIPNSWDRNDDDHQQTDAHDSAWTQLGAWLSMLLSIRV